MLAAARLLFVERPAPGRYLLVDDLNIVFIVLNTFVGFTTSVFSASYIAHELETGRLTPTHLRFYHAMYQVLMFGMNLALVANNIGLMWVAIELATLTTVLMVGIYRTHEALEAAWKYFILGSVGIALALFGTILVYMAAQPVVGEGLDAMVWTVLIERAAGFDPALLNVAFVFLLLGYGTKVGLAPLHAWLPDAHAEGPTPISAVLSGLLLNVALYAVLRFKMLLAANPGALAPGPLMVTMGLTSLVFAAFMLYRRRDIKRMFAYSSIEHMGIIAFAFGMGGPLANFAGLLHMTMHSLTKSAIFFAVGHIAQVKGTQKIADIRRPDRDPSLARLGAGGRRGRDRRPAAARHLHERVPGRELDLRARAAARDPAGVRPAGRVRRAAAAAQRARLRRARAAALRRSRRPTCRCSPIWRWCWSPASICRRRWSPGSSSVAGAARLMREGAHAVPDRADPGRHARSAQHRPWPRAVVDPAVLGLRRGPAGGRPLDAARPLGRAGGRAHGAARRAGRRDRRRQPRLRPTGGFRRSARGIRRRCGSSARSATCSGWCREGLPDHAPWLDHGRWGVRAIRSAAAAADAATPSAGRYRFLPAEGESLHQIPVGPVHAGIIEPGHFRFTASGETVVRLEERLGYVHKGIEGLMAGADLEPRRRARRPDLRRQHGRLCARLRPRGRGGARASRRRRARMWLRALMAELERLANHLGDIGAICNDAAFALMHAHCGVLRERVLRAADACFGHRLMRDRDRARRRRGRSRALTGADALRRPARRHPAALPGPGRALRQHRLAAGPHRRHRRAEAGARAPIRRRRLCRARLGPRLRRPPHAGLSALRPPRLRGAGARRTATSMPASGSASARSSRACR